MWVCIALIALATLVLVFYIIEKSKKYTVKSVLIKFAVSLLFVAVAAYSAYLKAGHPLNAFVIIGLVLGLSGDIWLDLKYVYPKDDKIYTYAGFIVFGIGHILFVSGLFVEFFNNYHALYAILPFIGAFIVGVINFIIAKPLKLNYGNMKPIVFIYCVLLFSTAFSALSLSIASGWQNTTLTMFFVGGVSFAISDLVLSNTYFGEGHEKPIDFILNYSTYYAAQFLIAFSLFFL